ncbi:MULTISPECIES: GNAT family N-acetyltransferase [Thermomonosporaceae]|uniref:GNAT family N-acetyltransferase n=1 Tax=Thermomonosporaceae TaxID=2012 RepID=UPI00255AE52A|nr:MULTISPECIES: GNAT family protein [Thermomonosporaceae]MDL4777514.1 GNAT family protein [Actinomadura xylanilytica]
MPATVGIRGARLDDAAPLVRLYQADRDHLRRWVPERDDSFFTPKGQTDDLRGLLEAQAARKLWPGVVLVDGAVAGRVTLDNILRGPMQSCLVGYWVARAHTGRGVATEAVRQVLDLAFRHLRLHRVEACTRVDNLASQRVLDHNGFRLVGTARRHFYAEGRWHDERVFERLAPWDDGVSLFPRPDLG